EDELPGLAAAYALDAVDDAERRAIDAAVADAAASVREEFAGRVRAHREALADHSRSTAQHPPAGLFDEILARIDEADAPWGTGSRRAGPADDAAAADRAEQDGQTGLPAPASLDERRRRRVRWARGVSAAAAAAIL